ELPGKKALIVGAGGAGEMLVRDMLRDPHGEFQPVAFVDDDVGKRGREIHGIRVAGNVERIPKLVSRFDANVVLIAAPSATSKQMRRIVDVCETCEIPVRTLPRISDLVGGQVSVKEMRDVRIEDLLGREAVKLDWPAITRGLGNKTILITGGGGSIGSELCRQVASVDPKKLVVMDQSELNLFTIDLELARTFPRLNRTMVLGDVCDTAGVASVLQTHAPDVIFHAAAYKHVPMLENQVRAAVWNNVIGTWTVAALAGRYNCGTFVLISSDKAVNPTNIMGASKRAAEICCRYFDGQSQTRYLTVRFGNVLGSTGSVIPLFREQIARGGPVTVTDPQITRYFMTTSEAAQLILQASVIGQGGEIFVLDMGEPIKIAYLARQLILLSGRKPDEDIEVVFTGLRPGEKLYEELFHEDETRVDTEHPKILLARSRTVTKPAVETAISELRTASMNADEAKVKEILRTLVPEHATSSLPAALVSHRAQRLAT
ncbi:MAG: nucleoside-diphosphate sugar epimerase/dehydratase, partial [Acidiferrobacterales bacterium]|nr:nucleoside-diphosphate sugar epimerase/dehydratase [Acidiferrobacterales bacterium]